METKEIKNKEIWEDFLSGCEEKTFLQSWNWGEFQKMMRNKIWRLGIVEEDKSSSSPFAAARVYNNGELRGPSKTGGCGGRVVVSVALVIKMTARRGTFLFVPHAPSVVSVKEGGPAVKHEILKTLLEELKKIAKNEKASFIRIAPIWQKNEENVKIFKKLGFREAPIHIHPELTWELDITPSEEELLMKMRKTTRYLIRQAQKNRDIEIIQSQNVEDAEKFNQLYKETVSRHNFVPFSLDYLKNEFLAFLPDNQPIRPVQGCPECAEGQISIFLGKYKEELISSGIFIFWQNIGFYHQGASSQKYPQIPVSYLVLWEAIKEAKRRGCKLFNFWGIAPINSEFRIQNSEFRRHAWYGLSLFKMGFGGYKKEYVKTQDFPLSKKYWLTYIFEKLRKIKRGF